MALQAMHPSNSIVCSPLRQSVMNVEDEPKTFKPQDEGVEFKPQAADDVTIYKKLAAHQTTEMKWELSAFFLWIQNWIPIFDQAFNLRISALALSVDWLRGNRLGQFRRGFNGLGLEAEVTIDRRVVEQGNQEEILAILLHELLHVWQAQHGSPSQGCNNHHNAEFRRRAAECGLLVDEQGHTWIPANSAFLQVVRANQDLPATPEMPKVPVTPPKKKAETKLKKWSCQCRPPVNVRVAVAHFSAKCLSCGSVFELQEPPTVEQSRSSE